MELEPLVYRVGEAAKVLGISKSKCYDLLANGKLPYVLIGQSKRIPVEGLRDWLKATMRPSKRKAFRRSQPAPVEAQEGHEPRT